MLQKYDAEQEAAWLKFDFERDEVMRRFLAAIMGAEFKDDPMKPKPSLPNGRKQTLTQQDIMRNYGKVNG